MKKIFVSIAAMTMLLAIGCQNEELVQQGNADDYTLTLDMGAQSRTMHNENGECVWGENEQLYVVGDGGKVFGTLTMKSKSEDGKKAVFSGKVTGDPAKLEFMVYPVPEPDGTIPMGNLDGTNHNAPMTGNINGGVVEDVDYAGGLIQIPVNDQPVVNVNATNENGKVVSGGIYTFDPETGKLTFDPKGGSTISISADEGTKYVYAPVHSTVPTGENETESITVEITIGDDENEVPQSFEVEIQQGAINTGIPSTNVGDDGEINYAVETESQLNTALSKGGEVKLTGDIVTENGITIPTGKEAILDLNGKTIKGTMHKSKGHVIVNKGNLKLMDGTVSSTAANGGSAVMNEGTMIVENTTLNGASNTGDSWPSYTVNNKGNLTISESDITSVHGALCSYGEGAIAVMNNTNIDMKGIPGNTSHGIYTYSSGKVIVNGGNIANKAADQNATGASVINGTVEVNDGNFSGRIEAYYGTPVIKGGSFTADPTKYVAGGYKATIINGKWVVAQKDMTLVQNAEELSKAIADGSTTIHMYKGTYNTDQISNASKRTLTLIGAEEGVEIYINQTNDVASTTFDGSTVTFKNLNITTEGGNYKGFARMQATYIDCTINKNYFTLLGKHVFEGCTFNAPSDEHCTWTYGATEVSFSNCIFNYSDRCVNIYVDNGTESVDVDFINCEFKTKNTASVGAIEINSSAFPKGTQIEITNCTGPAYGEMVFISKWDGTKGATATVKVNGSIIETPIQQ